jgi:hypothetical protein
VKVRGKRAKTVKRSRITALVNLTGLPQGRFTVSITATASDGRTVTGRRSYHTCAHQAKLKRPAALIWRRFSPFDAVTSPTLYDARERRPSKTGRTPVHTGYT